MYGVITGDNTLDVQPGRGGGDGRSRRLAVAHRQQEAVEEPVVARLARERAGLDLEDQRRPRRGVAALDGGAVRDMRIVPGVD